MMQFLFLVAASKAVERVYNVKPDLTREGGSIPVTLSFQDALQKTVLLLPMGRGDDVSHGGHECNMQKLTHACFRVLTPLTKSWIVLTTFKALSSLALTCMRLQMLRLNKHYAKTHVCQTTYKHTFPFIHSRSMILR